MNAAAEEVVISTDRDVEEKMDKEVHEAEEDAAKEVVE